MGKSKWHYAMVARRNIIRHLENGQYNYDTIKEIERIVIEKVKMPDREE